MSDGQDKSDDLIAELAKLMASSAGGAEPEAKPGPKLVSTPEPQAIEPRPAAPTIRIPGMDAPVAAAPQPVPAPVPPAPVASAPAPTIRIPGMDQPVAAAPRPVAPPPVATIPAEPRPVEHRAPTIDFGTLPPAATIRPEPMSNWQDREIPRPIAARPAVAADPVLTAPAPKVSAPIPAPVAPPPAPASAFTAAPAPTVLSPAVASSAYVPAKLDNVDHEPVAKDDPVIAGKPAPAGDSFDFDFGFGDNPPEAGEESRPAAVAQAARPAPVVSTGDPIADLIAAELDAAGDDEPAPLPARPPVQAPVIRSFPPAGAQAQPQVQLQPQQQRAVTTNPVRPPVAPAPKAAPDSMSAAEPDRFGSAPVFGASKAAAPAPVERDPMDEIESLIGEAVRVELSAPERPVVAERPKQAAPVVPPLTTGFAPRRAAIKETEPQVTSAEAAILAAAAATGADVGGLDGTMAAEAAASPYKRPKAKAEKKSPLSGGLRQYVGMAVAGTLLLAAGFGLYWVLGMGRPADTEAPVLTADATPAKEAAPVVAPKEDAEGSVVFNTTDGSTAAVPADEQIVSRDASVDTSVADVAETVGAEADSSTGDTVAAADGESELANRKVRTVTVRPDGTIVPGDDAMAGNSALPVDRPNVPEIPGAEVEPSPLLADTPTSDAPVDPTQLASTETPAATTADPLAVDPANIDPTIVAPVPMGRPNDRSVLGGGSNQQVAATNASGPVDLTGGDTQPAAAAPAISSAGGAYVQLSSQPTGADAQSSLRTMQNRLSGILNGRSLEIRQVDLGAKGVWYRVVLPTNSFSDATQTCASFKANGTDCVAING